MSAYTRRDLTRDKWKLPRTCGSYSARARFARRTWRTIRACRTLTACAVCRRFTAQFAARSVMPERLLKLKREAQPTTRSCSQAKVRSYRAETFTAHLWLSVLITPRLL